MRDFSRLIACRFLRNKRPQFVGTTLSSGHTDWITPGIHFFEIWTWTGLFTEKGERYFFRPAEWKNGEAWRCWNCSLTNVSLIFFYCNCWDVNNSLPLRFRRCKITAGVGNPFPRRVELAIATYSARFCLHFESWWMIILQFEPFFLQPIGSGIFWTWYWRKNIKGTAKLTKFGGIKLFPIIKN